MTLPVLDPELLQAFVAVADSGSFTRAAASLNRTQSAVSMQIKRLEQRVGLALFAQTRPRLVLSPAGESLLGYARRILTLNDEAVARLRQQKIEGVVRLGLMEDYGTLVVPPLLSSFIAAHPQIRVELETGLTAPMPARLGEAYDLVIAMHPTDQGGGELLRREQPVWAAGTSHELDDTAPLPLALSTRGCLFRTWAIEALDAARRPWRLAFVSQSLAALESVAAQGMGVTVVKAGVFPRKLRPLSDREGMPPLPTADIRLHRAAKLSTAGKLLADHLCATIRDNQPAGGGAAAFESLAGAAGLP